MNPGDVHVRPITLADVAGYRSCVGAVMGERKFLAYLEPFSFAQTATFVAENIENGNPHFVAEDSGQVVGWCDVRRESVPTYRHDGLLGMGLLPVYRGRGLGERLMRTTLDAARGAGFERISLSVYAQNTRAMALYRKVGFVLEGTRVRGRKVDDAYDDVHMMAYFFDAEAPSP
ncbi:MAG TPA: GNAT family N-acetyltransferase [Casimicrobiaceae bacterium]|nr:GNAT family N-acetyltransferase [Casimicrobiaceae bacterium]